MKNWTPEVNELVDSVSRQYLGDANGIQQAIQNKIGISLNAGSIGTRISMRRDIEKLGKLFPEHSKGFSDAFNGKSLIQKPALTLSTSDIEKIKSKHRKELKSPERNEDTLIENLEEAWPEGRQLKGVTLVKTIKWHLMLGGKINFIRNNKYDN